MLLEHDDEDDDDLIIIIRMNDLITFKNIINEENHVHQIDYCAARTWYVSSRALSTISCLLWGFLFDTDASRINFAVYTCRVVEILIIIKTI